MNAPAFKRLVTEHLRFPTTLLNLVAGLEESLWRDREAPERWSPLEIVRHLLDEEREDFRVRAQTAVQGADQVPGIRPQEWVTERRYNEADIQATLEEFEQERLVSCDWLRSLTLEQLDAELPRPDGTTMRAGDFIASWRIHDLLHLRQLTAAVATLEGRLLAPWKVDYAG